MSIKIFSSTELKGGNSLLELFLTTYNQINEIEIFAPIIVIVPHKGMGSWLKDQITNTYKVCANLSTKSIEATIVYLYQLNHPTDIILDFKSVTGMIYNYLCNCQLKAEDGAEVIHYIYDIKGILNRTRVYQLAQQLSQIFHQYLYFRTAELLNLTTSKFKKWQQELLTYIFYHSKNYKSFLDIYNYFQNLNLNDSQLILPTQLFIFTLNQINPAHLAIINKLAVKIKIFLYYQNISYENNNNPLVNNLGRQSQLLTELLLTHNAKFDIGTNSQFKAKTMLELLQYDIKNLKHRISNTFRINSQTELYANPLSFNQLTGIINNNNNFYDLEAQELSIKVNVCHNKMREVQVIFNQIIQAIDRRNIALSDVLITAPNIDDYASYITAVFAHETVKNKSGENFKLFYQLGAKNQTTNKILTTLQLLFNSPAQLTVNYFMEIITQLKLNLELSTKDIKLIAHWLQQNQVHFGYDQTDYNLYSYNDYAVHSFSYFLNNLSLGLCMPDSLLNKSTAPLYQIQSHYYTPYDNLDYSQQIILGKLINLINYLQQSRNLFYQNNEELKEFNPTQLTEIITLLINFLILEPEDLLIINQLLTDITTFTANSLINLKILNLLLTKFSNQSYTNTSFNGLISCASMADIRAIPFDNIYVLGLNANEFPRTHNPNQLNLLAQQWQLGDPNYELDDKQIFLELILATKKQLILSYIGSSAITNNSIRPSVVVNLILETLESSINDSNDNQEYLTQYNFKNLVIHHSLHPFHNNHTANYSNLWQHLDQNKIFHKSQEHFFLTNKAKFLSLSSEHQVKFYQLNYSNLCKTFLYTNYNLYQVLGINYYNDEILLTDEENFKLQDRQLAQNLYYVFNRYFLTLNQEDLQKYLHYKGIIGYGALGAAQFIYYHKLYQQYLFMNKGNDCELSITQTINSAINLKLNANLCLDNDLIIINEEFSKCGKLNYLNFNNLNYNLRIKALIAIVLLHLANKPYQVAVRTILKDGSIAQINLKLTDINNVCDCVLRYYLRSLTHPVLVHSEAIMAYVNDGHNKPDNDHLTIARNAYLQEFNNFSLDKIKQDMIFGETALDYFELAEINDINNIAKILLNLTPA